ncbi:MAG: hypothetical protein IPG53_23730 [Ignavibacteriales bacterium]|nr:hypothetical protein [Ignavibacteriales bacterium]
MFVFDNRRVVEVNTKEELEHVATCHYCNKPTSKYINCHNLKCDKIFVCCEVQENTRLFLFRRM